MANSTEDQPVGYAMAMTEEAFATLKDMSNLAENGIHVVKLSESWTEEDSRMMDLLPLAEQEFDAAIAAFNRAAEIDNRTTSRLKAAREDLHAAAETLRQTLDFSASR